MNEWMRFEFFISIKYNFHCFEMSIQWNLDLIDSNGKNTFPIQSIDRSKTIADIEYWKEVKCFYTNAKKTKTKIILVCENRDIVADIIMPMNRKFIFDDDDDNDVDVDETPTCSFFLCCFVLFGVILVWWNTLKITWIT